MKEETQINKTEYEDLYNITISKKIKHHHIKIMNQKKQEIHSEI